MKYQYLECLKRKLKITNIKRNNKAPGKQVQVRGQSSWQFFNCFGIKPILLLLLGSFHLRAKLCFCMLLKLKGILHTEVLNSQMKILRQLQIGQQLFWKQMPISGRARKSNIFPSQEKRSIISSTQILFLRDMPTQSPKTDFSIVTLPPITSNQTAVDI